MMRRVGPVALSTSARSGASTQLLDRFASGRVYQAVVPRTQRRGLWPFGKAKDTKVKLDTATYDRQHVHYTGSVFGVPMENIVVWLKYGSIGTGILAVIYLFFKGSMYLTQFSLATVGKLGFVSGFFTAMATFAIVSSMRRRYHIPPNAVYNQGIAMALKHPKVSAFLGPYPKTGEFRAYCATGGFKLPLMRRMRSGQYQMADMLGTKPRRLQMMFTLHSPEGKQGLVSCDVRKADGSIFGSSYYFHSLAVHLTDPATKKKEVVVLVGHDTDVVYNGILDL